MKTSTDLNRSDEQLIKEYIRGDSASLGILYIRYYTKVYHKCLSFTQNQDDAFDLSQDVLMKAFSNIESFKGSSKFSTWLYSITQNHCISQSSKSKKECCLDANTSYYLVSDNMDEDEILSRSHREDIEMKIDDYLIRLPENDRKMLELKYRYDYSIKDLQKEFNVTASAVKMRLQRARQKLESIIEKNAAA